MLKIACISLLLTTNSVYSQFAGPAGTPGSTAMHKDSSDFIGWANACVLELGFMDATNPGLGIVNYGDASSPVGFPNGLVVSLGDSGSATLTFATPIINGAGPDFAVFENSFSNSYLELGFVEVSSDGINFHRFPATSNTQTTTQIGPFEASTDAGQLYNLAGKYRASYGTPFDLQELAGISGLDLQHITHIRIRDVVGSISPLYSSLDQFGQAVNDPFPTPYPSSGFDLEAIGVIHQEPAGQSILEPTISVKIYPNPAVKGDHLHILTKSSVATISLYRIDGSLIESWNESHHILSELASGVYVLKVISGQYSTTSKVIVR